MLKGCMCMLFEKIFFGNWCLFIGDVMVEVRKLWRFVIYFVENNILILNGIERLIFDWGKVNVINVNNFFKYLDMRKYMVFWIIVVKYGWN